MVRLAGLFLAPSAKPDRSTGDTVYIGAYDGTLYAVERMTGLLRWRHTLGYQGARRSARPRRSGSPRWATPTSRSASATVISPVSFAPMVEADAGRNTSVVSRPRKAVGGRKKRPLRAEAAPAERRMPWHA
jgi:hypothetical protein